MNILQIIGRDSEIFKLDILEKENELTKIINHSTLRKIERWNSWFNRDATDAKERQYLFTKSYTTREKNFEEFFTES